MLLKVSRAILFFATLSVIGCAPDELAHLDELILEAKSGAEMPSGTAVIVIRGNTIVHEAYFGYADIAAEERVDADTIFYIASTTKAFLALAILLAEDRGDISRDTTLQELFPSLIFGAVDADNITVRHLLTHTSGIDNEPFTWAGSYTGVGVHDDASRHAMIAASYPSAAAALGEFEYSNIGYSILAVWLDDYYDRDWRDTLEDTVLIPLGMNRATGYISEAEANDWSLTQPYSYRVGNGKTATYLRKSDDTMYSVGLISTARHTARFVLATMNDGVLDGEQVFPLSVIRDQRDQQVEADGGYFDGYAFGWMTGVREDRPIRLHTGGFSGATASLSYIPSEKIGVVILHNENGLKANLLNSIIEDIVYASLLGQPVEKVDALVRPAIERLTELSADAKIQLSDDMAARAESKWVLSLEPNQYVGTYTHPLGGDIEVVLDADGLFRLSWGALRGTGFPGETLDTIQVDFRPGYYDPLEFSVDQSEAISLTFNGVEYSAK
jgi:CubicO group peptidase (beta-lactamase class C family)